jgi:membrane protein DedA with SNARE-associated domain
MSEIIKRSLVSIVWISFLGYLIWLLSESKLIVQDPFLAGQALHVWVVMVLVAFVTILLWVRPFNMPMIKRSLFVIWVGLVFYGFYIFKNDAAQNIHVSDLLRVYWVLVLILGSTWILVPKKVKKMKEQSKMEIIEI